MSSKIVKVTARHGKEWVIEGMGYGALVSASRIYKEIHTTCHKIEGKASVLDNSYQTYNSLVQMIKCLSYLSCPRNSISYPIQPCPIILKPHGKVTYHHRKAIIMALIRVRSSGLS